MSKLSASVRQALSNLCRLSRQGQKHCRIVPLCLDMGLARVSFPAMLRSEMKRHGAIPQNIRQAEARNRALHVLARMRRKGETLTSASREEHIDPRTVRKHLGSELRRAAGHTRPRPTKADRRLRHMLIPSAQGNVPAIVRGSRQASRLGRYMSAVGKYLRTGETGALSEFEAKSIAGHRLITDPETLSALAQAGALELDRIYAVPAVS